MKYYLNNCAAGLISQKTIDIMTEYLNKEKELGVLEAEVAFKDQIKSFYVNVAKLINADNISEIAFVDSATRAWNLALYGMNLKSGDEIVTLSSEFGTNLITTFDYASKRGAKLKIVNCNEEGDFSLDELENHLKKGARFIAISHVAAHGSIINPVEEIGRLAKKYDALYIIDGCQAVGHVPVDVKKINCDAYAATGRKWLCGPRGTGFLYVKSASPIGVTQFDLATSDLVLDENKAIIGIKVIEGAKKYELWEKNIANMLGLSNAIAESLNRTDFSKISKSANIIREAISKNTNLKLVGKIKSNCGIVGFYLTNLKNEDDILSKFAEENIIISTKHSYVCPLGFPDDASVIFRVSPHYYTSDEAISKVCNVILKL